MASGWCAAGTRCARRSFISPEIVISVMGEPVTILGCSESSEWTYKVQDHGIRNRQACCSLVPLPFSTVLDSTHMNLSVAPQADGDSFLLIGETRETFLVRLLETQRRVQQETLQGTKNPVPLTLNVATSREGDWPLLHLSSFRFPPPCFHLQHRHVFSSCPNPLKPNLRPESRDPDSMRNVYTQRTR